jgi:hypothetical protein
VKAYLIITGSLFGLLALVHVSQTVAEWPPSGGGLVESGIGLVAAALCVWAWRLVGRT